MYIHRYLVLTILAGCSVFSIMLKVYLNSLSTMLSVDSPLVCAFLYVYIIIIAGNEKRKKESLLVIRIRIIRRK